VHQLGKAKKRLLLQSSKSFYMTREDALIEILNKLKQDSASVDAKKLISLFGITAEELAEKGLSYEMLRVLDGVLI
jgi:hypothetical protein